MGGEAETQEPGSVKGYRGCGVRQCSLLKVFGRKGKGKIRMVTRADFPAFIFNNENVSMCFYFLFSTDSQMMQLNHSLSLGTWPGERRYTHTHSHTYTSVFPLLPALAAPSRCLGPGNRKHLRAKILSYLFLDPPCLTVPGP